jgi:ABC-2 type transport system permease protein
VSALFSLTLRQIVGGKRLWILGGFLGLPALLILMILGLGEKIPERDVVLTILIYALYPQSLVILATLLYGSGLLSAEIEARTLVYLLSRPLPRWKILVVKYAATVCILVALTLASLMLCASLAGFPGGLRTLIALSTSVVLACVAYTAIFALIGLLAPRRAVPVGLIYAGVLEIALSFVPAFVNQLSVSHYLRSLAYSMWRPEHLPAEAERFLEQALSFVGDTGPWASVLALLAFPAVALALSAALLELREYPLTDDL